MSAGSIIGGAVGAVAGYYIPGVGPYVGFTIGFGIGSMIDPIDMGGGNVQQPDIGKPQMDDVYLNIAEEGQPIADFLGITKLGGVIIYNGELRTEEVTEERQTGADSKGDPEYGTVTTGYAYFRSWTVGICKGPADTLLAVYREDEPVWSSNVGVSNPGNGQPTSITLKDMGTLRFYWGGDNQAVNDNIPGGLSYGGQCYAYFDDCNLGGGNRTPNMRFVMIKRPAVSWTPYENIGGMGYNPAAALHYIWTKMAGLDESWLDLTDLATAAQALYFEDAGISITFDRVQGADAYMESILKHIAGGMRYGIDGKMHLVLIRGDADPATLPEVTLDDLIDLPTIKRPGWVKTINRLEISYTKHDPRVSDSYEPAVFAPGTGVSIDGLTFERMPGSYTPELQAVTDNLGAQLGKWYFEVRYVCTETNPAHDYIAVGFVDESDSVFNRVGEGTVHPYPSVAAYKGNPGTLDNIIGVAVDIGGARSWHSIDGVWQNGSPANGTGGADHSADMPFWSGIRAVVGLGESHYSWDDSATANFGQTAFSYTAPTGFLEGFPLEYTQVADLKPAATRIEDLGHRQALGRVASKNISYPLYTSARSARQAGDRDLKQLSWPAASLSLPATRALFRYEVGDLFKFTCAPLSISEMICRVAGVVEEGPDTEKITISAIEDVSYITSAIDIDIDEPQGESPDPIKDPGKLNHARVMEGPHALTGESLTVIFAAAREMMTHAGFYVYMSTDGGGSYNLVKTVMAFGVHGELVNAYPTDTRTIDDDVGFTVDFDNQDVDRIENISRENLFQRINLALLGDELITFQTLTPVTATRYDITGIYRGRYDTVKADHASGTDFYYLGSWGSLFHEAFEVGGIYHFKLVPYRAGYAADITKADAVALTIAGRGRTPLVPANLKVNAKVRHAVYTSDCVLTWWPRLRTEGAGHGLAHIVTDAAPAWEGYFQVEVWVGGSLVRTASGINAKTWTYTSAMNTADNGSLATAVTFKLTNYRSDAGITYTCDPAQITVTKE